MCQKLINKNEAKPIPSHPKNITIKLSAVTKISIKPVNSDKYDINRVKCGSPFMYSVEYKWTNDETPQTTINIVVDNASKQKLQLTINNSEWIHSAKKMLHVEPKIAVSKNAKTDKKNAIVMAEVDKKQAPEVPIKRPKKMQDKKLKNGSVKIQRYIN